MNCRICQSSRLVEVLSLGEQYLSEFREDDSKPLKCSLDLMICKDCNQVQLKETAPLKLLYTNNYGYRSGINTTMRSHLQGIVTELTNMVAFQSGDIVVDIGSNDGTLLKFYSGWYTRMGYDLVSKFASDYTGTGIEFINEPFTAKNFGKKAKIITAISMFYDVSDPIKLMQDMAECLDDDGVIVIQQNYLLDMLRNNAFDNLCHEHICYHSIQSMMRIARACKLEVFDVKTNNLNGGSFRVYICHKKSYHVSARVKQQLGYELDYGLDHLGAYEAFSSRVQSLAEQLYSFVADIARSEESCYVYGASTRGNTLLQYCGLDNRLIQKAVERNPEKFGKKIASVGIPIISEEQARKEKPDHMLVLPWFFKEEFINRERKYLKSGGKLIFPLPHLEVVNA